MNTNLEVVSPANSGAKATAVQTLRDNYPSLKPREASGLRRVYRRFSNVEATN
jgi:hypothetical protein